MGANAQTTVPTFTAAQVLTADQMNQSARTGVPVFADTTARDAAFGGSGEKTLAEGQLCYVENLTGVAQIQYYDGATWVSLVASGVVQVKSATKTDTFTTTSTSYVDVTGLSVSITPTSASNKVFIIATTTGSGTSGINIAYLQLVRDSTALALGDAAGSRSQATAGFAALGSNNQSSPSMSYLDSPATTSATTYKVQMRVHAGTGYLNRSETDTNGTNFGRYSSSITVFEVTP